MIAKPSKSPGSPLCEAWRECIYLRNYTVDARRTIMEMEESKDVTIYRYAIKELENIREYLSGIAHRIFDYAHCD
jgi:hypothetical protein